MAARRGTEQDVPLIAELRCGVFEVPTDYPEADGTLEWSSTTVVTVEVRAGSTVGLGWTYASAAVKRVLEESLSAVLVGAEPLGVPGLHEEMVRRCRNLGRPGVVASAISAADIALWDLKARLLELPLADLFGRCRAAVPVYGSGGFTTYDDRRATAQLEHWLGSLGISQVKIKIGESWGTETARDLDRVEHARRVIGAERALFVDANGAYQHKQAIRIGRRLAGEHGVSWFEEPVSSDDLEGLREVRDQIACDVAAGEYGYDEQYLARMARSGAVDCLQADVTRCGGYTSWFRAAAIAAASGLDISGHCAPSLHTPVAASVPNLRHVEYFHDHERTDALLFDGALVPVAGALTLSSQVIGHGMTLKDPSELRVG